MTSGEKLYELLKSQASLLSRPLQRSEWITIADGYLKTLSKERKKAAVSVDAEAIYELYPKKVAKDEALKAITAALKKQPKEYLLGKTQQFAEAVSSWPSSYRYFQDGGDRCPNPSTWFNQGRYADNPKEWRRAGARNAPDRPTYSRPVARTQEEISADEAAAEKIRNAPEPPKDTLEHALWLEARTNLEVKKVVEAAVAPIQEVEHERRLRNA